MTTERQRQAEAMVSTCPACGGWHPTGAGPLSPRGAANIGMEYRYQCPCTCICGAPVRECKCPKGPTFVLVTRGLDGKPWNPPKRIGEP